MAYAPAEVTCTSAGLTTATTAYAVGDQAGTEMTLTSAAASSGGHGVITGIELVDNSARMGSYQLWIFNASTTPAADNAAASWSDADAAKAIAGGPIIMPAPYVMANNGVGGAGNLWLPFKCSGTANLYVDIQLLSVPTSNFFSAVGDLNFRFSILQWS